MVPAALVLSLALAPPAGAAGPACTIHGGDGADVLQGTPKADVICGGRGDDTIRGMAGDDVLYGGRGDDDLNGGAGDDRFVGGEGDDTVVDDDPLKNVPAWPVFLNVRYDLPVGTKLSYTYHLPSGHCIAANPDWTDTVGGPPWTYALFSVLTGSIFESCDYDRSFGTWIVKAETPAGDTGTVGIHLTSGLPNVYRHEVTLVCDSDASLLCVGGSDSELAEYGSSVRVPVQIGPLRAQPPPS